MIYKFALEYITVDAIIKDETIWLTQRAMADLFGVQTRAISKHLKNILRKESWMKKWSFPKWKQPLHMVQSPEKENMWLTTWENAPEGNILKSDVTVAKSYLSEKQIRQLERTVLTGK